MPELTITSPYVRSRVDSNTFTMDNPMPELTLILCQSRLYRPVRDFVFGLCWPVFQHEKDQEYSSVSFSYFVVLSFLVEHFFR
jgi:hypothetical protein